LTNKHVYNRRHGTKLHALPLRVAAKGRQFQRVGNLKGGFSFNSQRKNAIRRRNKAAEA
jgi:hypothetical protein